MALPSPLLERTWTAVPASVPDARHAVVDALAKVSTSDPPLGDIRLALSEAMANVVTHAYAGGEPGPVHVRVALDPEEIQVTVSDEGTGMVPRSDSPGLGLGMPLMATLTDRFEVRAPDEGGTRLCLWFRRHPAAATLPQ